MKFACFSYRIVLLFFLSTIAGGIAAADKDNFISISGKVVEGTRQKPVGQASVQLFGSNISTVTNNDGIFILNIPLNTVFTRLEIKRIGYSNRIVNAEAIALDKQNLFVLAPETAGDNKAELPAVSAEYLVEQAQKHIGRNYGKESLAKIAFYRESVKKGARNLSLAEVVLDVEKASYSSFDPDLVRLYKGRKITDYRTKDTSLVKFKGGIISLMMMDMVKKRQLFLDESHREMYDYKLEGTAYSDNRLHYIVSFNPRSGANEAFYRGKVYIDAENYAVSRVEFNMNVRDYPGVAEYFIHEKPSKVKVKAPEASYIIDFRNIDGDYTLYYAKMNVTYRCKQKGNWITPTYTAGAEMVITDEVDQPLVIRDNLVRVHANSILTEKTEDLENKDYWNGYNIIEPDKQVGKAIEQLVRASKLRSGR